MSPASKSKSKDKTVRKEPPKGSPKPSSGHVNTSGYNPILGTFHTFETLQIPPSSPLHANGRFRNIDETDDHNVTAGVEYDSVSNNGSWSGESEDPKEKTSHPHQPRLEAVPPGAADNDKREKIRQKNEKKHQRQKERRAQELHEKCSGYLMSRKLEALAQQLVAMGFGQERATMALILNEGRVEQSVAWLLEGGDEDNHRGQNLDGGGNLKIDISEELARVTHMEVRYKASKQEVERAVVASEGDLDMAEETLKEQLQEPPAAAPPKPEKTDDPPVVAANGKVPTASFSPSLVKVVQTKPASSSTSILQQRRDEKDFNYTKAPVTVLDPGTKILQAPKKAPQKLEWDKSQQITTPAEKRWPGAGSNPSVSYSLAPPPLQGSPLPAKTEPPHYVAVGNELKNLQLGSVRESPVMVMQRPQTINNLKQAPASNGVSSSPPGWYPPSVENSGLVVPPVAATRSHDVNSNPLLYNQLHYQTQQQYVSSSGSLDPNRGNVLYNSRGGASPTIAAASLGFFSGLGGNGPSGSPSPVDWTTGGSSSQLDYTNIDWSLDRGILSTRPNGLWTASNYSLNSNTRGYDSFAYGLGVNSSIRPVQANGNGGSNPMLQENVASSSSEPSGGGGSREWSSPFEEKDLFSLPRQFVSSPSL